ncbi:hypothetical protein N7516_009762 [Penicillium verrucosum]|uniref:uncharacterized protein n=1 Tax=Penicillium verrucosum TaxID=60171 RepID=UPI0025452708|nr:uncharacterized protein N7516_009762 [Penicillium verrucosum]KAJ5922059.1 hypothetical protein N7516_009762 [Penicillium verrucosum]
MGTNGARYWPRRPELLRRQGLATCPDAALRPDRANEKAEQLCTINPDIPRRGTVQQASCLASRWIFKGALKEKIQMIGNFT